MRVTRASGGTREDSNKNPAGTINGPAGFFYALIMRQDDARASTDFWSCANMLVALDSESSETLVAL